MMSEDIRRKLEDEAARQGVTFIVAKDGVLLEPGQCPTCRRWSGEPETCDHVDYNVGVMVREAVRFGEMSLMYGHAGCILDDCAGYVDTTGHQPWPWSAGESLAVLLLRLWAQE
jgi:hypothetical protein